MIIYLVGVGVPNIWLIHNKTLTTTIDPNIEKKVFILFSTSDLEDITYCMCRSDKFSK
jgi:hypothetical protein